MNKKTSILFVVYTKWYNIYKPLVEELNRGYEVNVLFLDSTPEDSLIDKLNSQGVRFLDLTSEMWYRKYFFIFFKLSHTTNKYSIRSFMLEKITYFFLHYYYKYFNNYLINNDISLIYFNQDNYPTIEAALLKSAKDLNIKTILPTVTHIFPYISQYKLRDCNVSSSNDSIYQKYIFKKFNKKNFLYQQYNDVYRYNSYLINAHYKFGSLSKLPHLIGGSEFIDIVPILDKLNYDYLKVNNYDIEKVVIVGEINYDKLYESYKNKNYIRKMLVGDTNDKIIIIGVPQLYEHGISSFDVAKKEIEYLISSASNIKDTILLLSLHPSMNLHNYKYLEEKFVCKIIDSSLSTFLPIADLYICATSGTIVWSILCDIPVIECDFYNLKYDLNYELQSPIVVSEKSQLHKIIVNSLEQKENNFYFDQIQLSRNKVFDGKVLYRYLEITRKLLKKSNNKRVIPNKGFFDIVFIFMQFIGRVEEYFLSKYLKYKMKGNAQYYLTPYNRNTINLRNLLNRHTNSQFLGFIDSYKLGEDIIHPKELLGNQYLVLILSPKYKNEIYKSLKIYGYKNIKYLSKLLEFI